MNVETKVSRTRVSMNVVAMAAGLAGIISAVLGWYGSPDPTSGMPTPVSSYSDGLSFDWVRFDIIMKLPEDLAEPGSMEVSMNSMILNTSSEARVWRPKLGLLAKPGSVTAFVSDPRTIPKRIAILPILKDGVVSLEGEHAYLIPAGDRRLFEINLTLPIASTGQEIFMAAYPVLETMRWELRHTDPKVHARYRVMVKCEGVIMHGEDENGSFLAYETRGASLRPSLTLAWVPENRAND